MVFLLQVLDLSGLAQPFVKYVPHSLAYSTLFTILKLEFLPLT